MKLDAPTRERVEGPLAGFLEELDRPGMTKKRVIEHMAAAEASELNDLFLSLEPGAEQKAFLRRNRLPCLPKPFRPDELESKVRAILSHGVYVARRLE